jgi:hypothetical protein
MILSDEAARLSNNPVLLFFKVSCFHFREDRFASDRTKPIVTNEKERLLFDQTNSVCFKELTA